MQLEGTPGAHILILTPIAVFVVEVVVTIEKYG
jgi:hypothetical protein